MSINLDAVSELHRALEAERERTRLLDQRVRELEAAAAQLETYAADLSRTYAEMRRHLQHMTVLHGAQVRMASALDLNGVVSALLGSVGELVEHSRAVVYLLDSPAIPGAGSAGSDSDPVKLRPWASASGAGETPLATEEERGPIAPTSLPVQAVKQSSTLSRPAGAGLKGAYELAIPLRAAGRCIGVLEVSLPAGAPTDRELTVMELLAGGAGVAVHNAHLYQETQRLAVTDPLTGLANHRQFHELLRLEVERGRRGGYPVGFLMMDLDHFKLVNDRYLHPTGNSVLRQVADAVQRRLRRTDIVGRLGGEEFGAVLPAASDEEVRLVGESLRRAVEELPPIHGDLADSDPPLNLTMSVGGASLSAELLDADRLEQFADRALYAAKRGGRNRFCLWTPQPA